VIQIANEQYQKYRIALFMWGILLLVLGVRYFLVSDAPKHNIYMIKAILQISYSIYLLVGCVIYRHVKRLKRVLIYGVIFVAAQFMLDLFYINEKFNITFVNFSTTLLASILSLVPYIWAFNRIK
jgi:hypothetical protein